MMLIYTYMYMYMVNHIIIIMHSDDEKQPKRKKKFDEKQRYGCGYMEVRQAKREYFTTTWGPLGFSKENHPLQIMASGRACTYVGHSCCRESAVNVQCTF